MRVIIPAAGLGTRLLPLTRTTPKAMVSVCKKPLLAYTLEWLSELDVSEVVVVLGHHGDNLREALLSLEHRPALTFVNNPLYASTDSILSLHLTISSWADPFCIIDSDVIAAPTLLQRLIEPGPSALVVDTTKQFEAADMKVELRGGFVWHMDKPLERTRHQGEFFGLSRWSGDGLEMFALALDRYVNSGQTRVWYEFPIRDVAKRTDLTVIPATEDEWAEVDQFEDIPKAEELVTRLVGA